jgi:plastocyanin
MRTALGTRGVRVIGLLASASLVAVALPAIVASSADAATQTVTITKDGYVPAAQTISAGDTVIFANADATVHEVSFKQTTGFTCTATPLVVQPAAQQSCTFTAAGAYSYSDPKQNGPGFRGTITVNAVVAPSVTLSTSTPTVRYGNQAVLSGKVSPAAAGTSVDIMALEFGEAASEKVATTVTTASGAFSVSVAPQIRTTYRATFSSNGKAIDSTMVMVQVRPRVSLALRFVKQGYGYFRTKAVSTVSYAGKRALVQHRNVTGGWTTIKGITLGSFSSARFKVRLPNRSIRIRVLLPTGSAGPGYLAGYSRGILLTR